MKITKFFSLLFVLSLSTSAFSASDFKKSSRRVVPLNATTVVPGAALSPQPKVHRTLALQAAFRNAVVQREAHDEFERLDEKQLEKMCSDYEAAVDLENALLDTAVAGLSLDENATTPAEAEPVVDVKTQVATIINHDDLESIFNFACKNGKTETAKLIIRYIMNGFLTKHPQRPFFTKFHITTAFSHAVSNGHEAIVDLFLARIVTYITTDQFTTSFNTTATKGDTAVVSLLLNNPTSSQHISNDVRKAASKALKGDVTKAATKKVIDEHITSCC